MKKLKVDDLPDADNLTDEEKKAILGGTKGAFDLNLTGGQRNDVRKWRPRLDGVRFSDDLRDNQPGVRKIKKIDGGRV